LRLYKLLLMAALGGCGAPGSESVFTKGNPKAGAAPGSPTQAVQPPRPPAQPIKTKQYIGLYRRLNEQSRFQPCHTERALDIFGPFDARQRLQERMRYGSDLPGLKMYAVFEGAVVTDTVRPQAPDSATTVRTRFYLARVDSLRTWERSDCGGWRVN
jgi:hypothetical protein